MENLLSSATIPDMRFLTQEKVEKVSETLFLLIIFFLPTQLGKHFWPEFSVVAGMRIDYLSPTVFVTDVLICLFLISCLFSLGGLTKMLDIVSRGIYASLEGFILKYWYVSLLGISLGLGILFCLRPPLGGTGFVRFMEIGLFGILAVKFLRRPQVQLRLPIFFAGAMLIQACLAILQFYNQGSLGGIFYLLGERTFTSATPGIANASLDGALLLRPYGTLPHPNVLAGYLLTGMLLLLATANNQQSTKSKFFIIFTLVVSCVGFLLTMSRSAITAGVLLLIGKFIFSRIFFHVRTRMANITLSQIVRTENMLPKLIILVLLGILTTLVIYIVTPRFLAFSFTEEAIVQRLALTHAAWEMIKDSPLVGVGLQNFISNLPYYQHALRLPLLLQPVHNIYLLIAAETGIVGLTLFLFFIYRTVARIQQSEARALSAAFLIVILLTGFLDHYWVSLQQGRLLLVFILSHIWS